MGTGTTRILRRGAHTVRVMQSWALTVIDGPQAGLTVKIASPIFRVGSHPSNDLVLDDPTVSRQHVEFSLTPEGYRISDLSSSNGTFLGMVQVSEVTVSAEVELQLGSRTLRLCPSVDEVEVPASAASSFGRLLGRSVPMRELYTRLEMVSRSDCSVLIEGETGVGKELVAESIHLASARAAHPFVVIDCASLPGGLAESELFGHVRGAFTGAHSDRAGLLVQADGGTIVFDEVDQLPLPLQAKLLGALERQSVTPLGASIPKPIDVRVIAATHRDLPRLVNEQRFRSNLFYSLSVVRLRVPPLRERADDLPILVESFLAALRTGGNEDVPESLSAIAMASLADQPWPGNVRELRNAVERAAVLSAPDSAMSDLRSPQPYPLALEQFIATFEREYLRELLEQNKGDRNAAARQAGIDRRHLQRLMHRYCEPGDGGPEKRR